MQHRQGDVMVKRIDGPIPVNAKLVDWNAAGRVILAYGEVTGHAHALSCDYAKMYRWENERLLHIKEGAVLTHEEHGSIALEPGIWQVIQQREYHPQELRNVLD